MAQLLAAGADVNLQQAPRTRQFKWIVRFTLWAVEHGVKSALSQEIATWGGMTPLMDAARKGQARDAPCRAAAGRVDTCRVLYFPCRVPCFRTACCIFRAVLQRAVLCCKTSPHPQIPPSPNFPPPSFILADCPGLGGSDGARKRVRLFLKTLLSLIVFCAGYLSYVSDTCLMCLILVLCV